MKKTVAPVADRAVLLLQVPLLGVMAYLLYTCWMTISRREMRGRLLVTGNGSYAMLSVVETNQREFLMLPLI